MGRLVQTDIQISIAFAVLAPAETVWTACKTLQTFSKINQTPARCSNCFEFFQDDSDFHSFQGWREWPLPGCCRIPYIFAVTAHIGVRSGSRWCVSSTARICLSTSSSCTRQRVYPRFSTASIFYQVVGKLVRLRPNNSLFSALSQGHNWLQAC